MLNGIGGKTIAEAKENISHREALAWARYIAKRGSLNLGTRLEWGVARLAVTLVSVHGGKAEMSDFMPHLDKPKVDDKEPPATIQQAFKLLTSLKKTPANAGSNKSRREAP